MAVQTVLGDTHLYSTGAGFSNSANPFSINVWINANWNAGTTYSMVGLYDGTPVGTGTPTNGGGVQIGTRTGGGELDAWTYGGAVLVGTATGTMTPYSNKWCMITYTGNYTTHNLYVNGVLNVTATTAFNAVTFTQVYINGYPPTGTTNEVSAFQIDSYSYFGRELAASEILTIFNAGGSRHGITNGLLARYEFDELPAGATVVTALDMSGNGNNLTEVGTAVSTYTYTNVYANANMRVVL